MRFIIPILLLFACSLPVMAGDRADIKLDLGTALSVFDELDRNQNYIDDLAAGNLTKLPVGQKRTLSNVEYTVGITQVKFHPEYAEFTAFLRIKVPQQQSGKVKDLFFGAHGIKLSYSGGIIGDVKLGLLGDYPFDLGGNNIVTLKGAFDKDNNMINGGEPVTYASIDCSGFRMLSIKADIAFSRDLLVPDSLGVPGKGILHTSFATTASDWNDILVDIQMPAFQVNGLKDFVFNVNHAVFDFSDLRNDAQTVFPSKYQAEYMLPGSPALWRGVYISGMDVTLPKLFSGGDTTKRIKLSGKNMLIDNMGFTGLVTAKNLITIDTGRAGGWPVSIDRFSLDIMANNLQGAGFGGSIMLPVDDKTELEYDALISPGNEYMLTVKPKDTISFGLFRASNVELFPNSLVELKVKDHKFIARAVLNGKMTINVTMKKDAPADDAGLAKLPAIEFRGLELQTVSPKLKIGSMGYTGEIKFGNFPASINNIEVAASNNEARLSFGIDVQLMGEGDGGFRGGAKLAVIGKLSEGRGIDSWKFDRIKLDSLGVHFDKGGVCVDGHIFIFEDDPVYGKGFAGDIALTLKKLNLEVKAKAIFGKLPTYRYWYADAYVNLGNAGIPIFPGIMINGFGGGAYERMKLNGMVTPGTAGIGVAPTGSVYVPDDRTSFGLKAMVGFASQDGKVVNGHLTLEMAFAATGGIRYIHFDGVAKMMKNLPVDQFKQLEKKMNKLTMSADKAKSADEQDREKLSSDAALTAVASLDLDFENSSLHSVFEVYLNAGVLKGVGAGNLAGRVVMHYDPHDWYIHMGRPDNRMGVKFGIGPIALSIGTYLMAGTQIPGSPPPPQIIADILGLKLAELDYMKDLNALGDGKGVAFGADLSFTTGDLTFLMFYARFDAGLGFDLMLKDYGEAQCKGADGPIGINGWYANGQAYAYFQGDVGIVVKLFMKTKKISILKVGAAVLMQAKLPNPAWFRAYVGGYYSVLGGLVKGRCNFKVTLGEECELINGNPLGNIQVISAVNPGDAATDVDVFAAPQAVFNMAVEKEMELADDDGNVIRYRVKLDKFELSSAGKLLAASLLWNDDRNGVAIFSEEVLPPHATVKATVVVSFEELKGGSWRTVMANGQRTVETKEISFTTGDAPESIPMHNIQYAYPVPDQQHLYTEEYKSGYVQLKRGQSYLFDKSAGWKQIMRQKDAGGNAQLPAWSYDTTSKRLGWTFPAMGKTVKYTMEIVNVPPSEGGASQAVNAGYTAVQNAEDGNDMEIRNNQAGAAMTNTGAGEKMILTYDFTTSSYNTFAEKIRAGGVTKVIREPIYLPDVHALQVFTTPTETFDDKELTGDTYSEGIPLINTTAVLESDNYFNQVINPLVYSQYPYNGLVNIERERKLPLVPTFAVYPIETYLLYPDAARLPFRYHLPKQYKTDLMNIQTQLASKSIYTPLPAQYHSVLNALFPVMTQGTYKMKLLYVLPGGKTGSSTVVEMYNPIL